MKKIIPIILMMLGICGISKAQTVVRMSSTTSGVDNYQTLFNPNVAAFNSSTVYVVPFGSANTSGTITLDPDSGGPGAAVSIKGDDGNDLAVGAIKAGGTYQFKFNGTLLRMIGSAGGGGWPLTGTANFTGDVTIDNGVHNLLIGDITGPWSSWDIDGTGPTGIPNSRSDGIGDPLGTTYSYLRHAVSGGDSEALLETKNATGSQHSYVVVGASATPCVSMGTTGEIDLTTATVQRLSIHANGSWRLGAGEDAGAAGEVFTSNGVSAEPTWQAGLTNTAAALTDGAAITITGVKHTLTSTQATVTWTLSQTPDFQTTDIILNATSTTWTFPAGALCVTEGTASGNNTAALAGVSGDHYIMSIYKDGTNYRVVIKNFGQ